MPVCFLAGEKSGRKVSRKGKFSARFSFLYNKKDSSINTEIFLAVRRGIEPLFPP